MQSRVASGFLGLLVLALSHSNLVRAAEADGDTVREGFKVKAGGKLVVRADRGSLRLSGGQGSEAEIEVIRRVSRGSAAQARDLIQDHEVRFAQDGDTIRVETASRTKGRWNLLGPNLEVEIRVVVPREFSVDAETAGGSVQARDLRGDLDLRTSGGSLNFEGLAGTVQGRTSGGSIRATRMTGTVKLTTSGGSISVEDATGEALQVQTSGGSLRLTGVAVPVEAKTSGGSIHLEATTGPVKASTSGGSIRARLTAVPKGDLVFQTSAGSIELRLPGGSAFDLDAATSAGSVRSEFDVGSTSGKRGEDRSSLRGPVNGGGPVIRLRTSAGGIRLRRE